MNLGYHLAFSGETHQVHANLLAEGLNLVEETSVMYALNLIEYALRWQQGRSVLHSKQGSSHLFSQLAGQGFADLHCRSTTTVS